MSCFVCSQPDDGLSVHAACLTAGLLLAAAELVAVALAPVVIVWAG